MRWTQFKWQMGFVLLMAFGWLAAFAMLAVNPAQTQPTDNSLFMPVVQPDAQQADQLQALIAQNNVVRARAVTINGEALRQVNTLRLNLFDDTVLDAVLTRLDDHATLTGYTWVGAVAGYPYSTVVLSVSDGLISGFISTSAGQYQIRYAGSDGVHRIVQDVPVEYGDDTDYPDPEAPQRITITEYDRQEALPVMDAVSNTTTNSGGGILSTPQTIAQQTTLTLNQRPDPANRLPLQDTTFGQVMAAGDAQIDVVVGYTPAAESFAGGNAAILNDINTSISLANSGLTNSNVTAVFNLVGTVKTESFSDGQYDLGQMLDFLEDPNDGVFDIVTDLRSSAGGDLVMLYADASSKCGIGNLPGTLGIDQNNRAFSVTHIDCVTSYTPAHEMGHNLGLEHNFEDSSRGQSGGRAAAVRPYAFGYRDPGYFRTIMSYSCTDDNLAYCVRVGHFSNPDVNYNGRVTGLNNTEDNARVLDESSYIAALYRSCPQTATQTVAAGDEAAFIEAFYIAAGDYCNTGPKTISLGGGIYTFLSPISPDNPDDAWPEINNEIIIDGNGSTINLMSDTMRLALIDDGHLTVRNVTISGLGTASAYERGGLFYLSQGQLTVENSTLQSAHATWGGAIYSYQGTVNITDSTLQNNTSGDSGAAVYSYQGNTIVQGSTFSNNISPDRGGAFYDYEANLEIYNSTLSNNQATAADNLTGDGGAIYTQNGTLLLDDVIVSGNTAADDGGVIYSYQTDVTLTGSTFSNNSVASDQTGGVLYVFNDNVSVTNSNFTANSGGYGGVMYLAGSGAAMTPTISNSTFTDNTGFYGAALYLSGANLTTTISNSTLHNNDVTGFGGALVMYNAAKVIITGSTFSDNDAGQTNQSGGAINAGSDDTIIEITNSTFSNNTAFWGGAINFFGSTLDITSSTFVDNDATGNYSNSGDAFYNNATATLRNTILQGTGNDCYHAGSGISLGYNISDDSSCGLNVTLGDLLNTDAQLGPLTNNLGSTDTHALLSGSPAIDLVPVADCVWDDDANDVTAAVPLLVDQRGQTRPSGGACDAGAFEVATLTEDVDGDGSVTPIDAIFVINRLGQTVNVGNEAADVNDDGFINTADATQVLNALGIGLP